MRGILAGPYLRPRGDPSPFSGRQFFPRRARGHKQDNIENVMTLSADGGTLDFGTLGCGVWKRTFER